MYNIIATKKFEKINKNMNILDEYRFISDTEPTDEQLSLLMKEVAKDVKESNKKSTEEFWANINKMMENLEDRRKTLLSKYNG